MDKEFIIQNIIEHKSHPKTIFEWMDFLGLNKEDRKLFIQNLDKLVDTYEVIIRENKLYLGEWFNYFHGEIKVNKRGFGFIDFEDRPSIYISKKNLFNVFNKDIVVVKVINSDDEAVIEKIIKRSLDKIVGTLLTQRKPYKFIADNFMYENQIRINNADKYKNIHRHKVLLQVKNFDKGLIYCDIVEVLGHVDDPGVDSLAILLENDVRVSWPNKVKEELKHIPSEVLESDKRDRRNLVDDLIFTIDGDDAKDLDDAISIKVVEDNYLLSVHIMDVDYYVNERSAIDEEAYLRGTSIYMADKVVSMLPQQLSNGICSLHEQVERLTITVEMKIDQEGNVLDFDIYPSVIKSKKRLTYKKVNQLLANPLSIKDYALVENDLNLMYKLSEIIQRKRDLGGAIDFDRSEIELEVNQKGLVNNISIRNRDKAERMIENFMVLTNEVVARLLSFSQWPGLYRVHEKPDAKKMRSFATLAQILGYQMKGSMDEVHPHQLQKILNESSGSDNHFIIANQLLRSMQKARYDFNNIGHFGLGSSEYSHFTAPIRRYPDLIVHRLVKKYFFDNDFSNFDSDEKYLEEAGKHLSELERKAISVEREVNDMKIAEYMETQVGNKYKGIISSVHEFGMFIQLDNLVEGLVRTETLGDHYYLANDGFSLVSKNNVYRVGDKVKVKLIKASKLSRNIDFELLKG